MEGAQYSTVGALWRVQLNQLQQWDQPPAPDSTVMLPLAAGPQLVDEVLHS